MPFVREELFLIPEPSLLSLDTSFSYMIKLQFPLLNTAILLFFLTSAVFSLLTGGLLLLLTIKLFLTGNALSFFAGGAFLFQTGELLLIGKFAGGTFLFQTGELLLIGKLSFTGGGVLFQTGELLLIGKLSLVLLFLTCDPSFFLMGTQFLASTSAVFFLLTCNPFLKGEIFYFWIAVGHEASSALTVEPVVKDGSCSVWRGGALLSDEAFSFLRDGRFWFLRDELF